MRTLLKRAPLGLLLMSLAVVLALPGVASAAKPEYEAAYYNGQTVTINAIEVSQHDAVLTHAAADFYLVVYPIDWQARGLPAPQCNPCDHDGGGIDFIDFHDHTLDSIPSSPGHGEFNPLWHVFAVLPAYSFITGGDPAKDAAIADAYSTRLPMKSEAAVDSALASTLPDGTPIAVEMDLHFYFLCAVVNSHAAG
jgi:hypothetical protein